MRRTIPLVTCTFLVAFLVGADPAPKQKAKDATLLQPVPEGKGTPETVRVCRMWPIVQLEENGDYAFYYDAYPDYDTTACQFPQASSYNEPYTETWPCYCEEPTSSNCCGYVAARGPFPGLRNPVPRTFKPTSRRSTYPRHHEKLHLRHLHDDDLWVEFTVPGEMAPRHGKLFFVRVHHADQPEKKRTLALVYEVVGFSDWEPDFRVRDVKHLGGGAYRLGVGGFSMLAFIYVPRP